MSREDERHLSTADLARGAEQQSQQSRQKQEPMEHRDGMEEQGLPLHEDGRGTLPAASRASEPQHAQHGAEPLAALFPPQMAEEMRRRWDSIQIGFVDDPRAAVHNADELVAQVLRNLAESFADQRSEIDQRLGQGGQGNTEEMRVALQRYRSFFQRLLAL